MIAQESAPEPGKKFINLRATELVRQKLDAARQAQRPLALGRSHHRVEQSIDQDDVLGGPELRRIAYAMATTFALAGQYSAGPGVPFKDWSPASRITAITSVVETLAQASHLSDPDLRLLHSHIGGQLPALAPAGRSRNDRRAYSRALARIVGVALRRRRQGLHAYGTGQQGVTLRRRCARLWARSISGEHVAKVGLTVGDLLRQRIDDLAGERQDHAGAPRKAIWSR